MSGLTDADARREGSPDWRPASTWSARDLFECNDDRVYRHRFERVD